MPRTRDQLAARAARELQDGFYVNVGIGIPTLVANYIPVGIEVTLQSEDGDFANGMIPSKPVKGMGGAMDLATAGKVTVVEVEYIVPTGTLDPDHIHTPGIYVDRLVRGDFEKRIERCTVHVRETA
jgi:acyl CoA:acetate/3-ketoacid CoA transferase beta subunit